MADMNEIQQIINNHKGYDPESFGLIKYGYQNDDERYTAVELVGGITKYALHPLHFTPAITEFLDSLWTGVNVVNQLNTDVYVKTASVNGFRTHNEFLTETLEYAPIYLIKNPINGKNPYEYEQELQNQETEQYGGFYLNYGVTIEPFTLDIRDLPDIDLGADSVITVNIGDISITRPLTHLLDPSRGVDPVLTIAPGAQTATGFWFAGDFAGRNFASRYNGNFTQAAVLDGYTDHMLQNKNREAALQNNQTYNAGISALSSVMDGGAFGILGGIGSTLDAVLQFALRSEMFEDMGNQHNNIGGDILHDALGQDLDVLVTVSYPIQKKLDANLVLGDFEVNRPRSFDVYRVFNSVKSAYDFCKDNFKGNIVNIDMEPRIEYGEYSKYFKQIIDRGGLL